MTKPRKTLPLVVLGAGPKGVAIWTKHWALNKAGVSVAPIEIIERKNVGSHWKGNDGFTDGFQLLVTPSEQDLGYPYALNHEEREKALSIRNAMLTISWMQYLLSKNTYCGWVAKDRPRVEHQELVDYLNWAAEECGMKTTNANVTSIDIVDGEWAFVTDKSKTVKGQGLVITGSGAPRRIENQPDGDARILDGKSFWNQLEQFDGMEYKRVAVIGAGETAAAIAAALLDRVGDRDSCTIDLLCKQNAYFTRGQVQKDLRYFSDPTGWTKLSPGRRLSIIRRADRGVVSVSIKSKLEDDDIVGYTNAEVIAIEAVPGPELLLTLKFEDGDTEKVKYHYAIVATGFDALWFFDLFSPQAMSLLFSHLLAKMPKEWGESVSRALNVPISNGDFIDCFVKKRTEKGVSKLVERAVSELIADDLSLSEFKPRLHLPMLAGLSQGPGFPNLNCLGLLSDRILETYLE